MFGLKKGIEYCAIDIEATGFDPLTEEILEIGFAFFTLGKTGVKITEEWSQIFRPSKQVSSKILALTGISDSEIKNAPKLSEFHEYVQKKLKKAVLVGYSVGVDVKYLEANGFHLSGRYIDTLELVQFVLPTHHSYNLENLMHFFQVSHTEAHRALADARASISLLEKLLGMYQLFPSELKKDIDKIIKPFEFAWEALLSADVPGFSLPAATRPGGAVEEEIEFRHGTITALSLSERYQERILGSLKNKRDKFLFVVPYKYDVLRLWKAGLGEGIFGPEDTFDQKRFEEHLKDTHSNADFAKFLLKILVWKYTNWQTTTILDLNLSFAGNQFRFAVAGGKPVYLSDPKILLADQQTFLNLNSPPEFIERFVLIQGLSELETQLTSKIGERASWGNAIRLLTSIYNPETGFGEPGLATQITEMLSATDLFFGLTVITLQAQRSEESYLTKEELELNARAFSSLSAAAKNYTHKMEILAEQTENSAIKKFISSLNSFFNDTPGRVRWIDFGEHHCVFHNNPLRIDSISQAVVSKLPKVCFVDSLPLEVINYFKIRLGLQKFNVLESRALQDSFQAPFNFYSTPVSNHNLAESVLDCLPTAVVLLSYKNIKEFYDSNYRFLQTHAAVFAEGYSGGVNKMFNNFTNIKNGLLLVTGKTVAKINKHDIAAKSLIISDPQVDIFTDPYTLAVEKDMLLLVPETKALKILHNLHKIIQVFFTEDLREVSLYALKTEDGYIRGQLVSYLEGLGFAPQDKSGI